MARTDVLSVGVHVGCAAQVALALGDLLGEDVAHERRAALDRAASADAKRLAAPLLVFIFGMITPVLHGAGGASSTARPRPRRALQAYSHGTTCSTRRYAATAHCSPSTPQLFGFSACLSSAAFVSPSASCTFFFGASTITICRPSSFGNCSTTPYGSRSLPHPLQQPHAELLVRHLAAAEAQRHLGLVALLEEPDQVAQLDLVVALVGARPELDFLDLDLLLLELGLVRLLLSR